jgi:hypothetical protein
MNPECKKNEIDMIPVDSFKIITSFQNYSSINNERPNYRMIYSDIYSRWNYLCQLFHYNSNSYDETIMIKKDSFFLILLDLLQTKIKEIYYSHIRFESLFHQSDFTENDMNNFENDNTNDLEKKLNIFRWLYMRDLRIRIKSELESRLLTTYDTFMNCGDTFFNRIFSYQMTFWNIYKQIVKRMEKSKKKYEIRIITFSQILYKIQNKQLLFSKLHPNEIWMIYQDMKVSIQQLQQILSIVSQYQMSNIIGDSYYDSLVLLTNYDIYLQITAANSQYTSTKITENNSIQRIIYIHQNKEWKDKIEKKLQIFFQPSIVLHKNQAHPTINSLFIWLVYYLIANKTEIMEKNQIVIDYEMIANYPEYEKLFMYYLHRKKYIFIQNYQSLIY